MGLNKKTGKGAFIVKGVARVFIDRIKRSMDAMV
jgi:hypothetical protein